MKLEWSRWTPPGVEFQKELRGYGLGAAAAALYSLLFPIRLINAIDRLYQYTMDGRERIPGVMLPEFTQLMQGVLYGVLLLAVCMAVLAIYHYGYYRMGSRSIYLMRRLPNRWEYHRRNLALPVAGIAGCVVLAALLLVLYWGLYRLCAPSGSIPVGGSRILWGELL